MTKKQFKEAMLRGQGRCVQAVQADPERYRPLVLWACSHPIAFDAQCEGTRTWYVYQMIRCYGDQAPFLEAVIASLRCTRPGSHWKMEYFADLLICFARDGEDAAEKALWDKYDELYAMLMKGRRRGKGPFFFERDAFEMLCGELAVSKAAMVRIAEDIGRLYREKAHFSGADFDRLYEAKAARYMKTLTRRAEKSENIAAYLRMGREWEAEKSRIAGNRKNRQPQNGVALSNWLKKKADRETVQRYAAAYLAETDPERRAQALAAFCRCPFPENPSPIIADAESDCENLRDAAWEALTQIRHPLVREFAMANLQKDAETILPMLIMNYREQDERLLVDLVQSVAVDYACSTAWHEIHMDILHMADRSLKAPASLLRFIFETSYCSCCREDAIRQMGKRRLLTGKLLGECLYDANDDIREYARRRLRRMEK